jgi:two-component system sensor histidine kinase BaeS
VVAMAPCCPLSRQAAWRKCGGGLRNRLLRSRYDRCAMSTSEPRRLRLSLVHQLVFLLVGAVLLAVTVLGAAVAWNLRAGFSDYLRARDEHWLDRFAEVATAAVAERGLAALSGPPGSLRPLFDAVAPAKASPPHLPHGHPDDPRPGPGGRPPPGGMRTPERLSVVDATGRPLAGRPLAPSDISTERPLVVDGRTVARVQLARAPFASADVDAAFLARQYLGIVLAALTLALLAVSGAVWAGRRWLRPVRAVQHAARQVAEGAFDVRLVPHGNDELADLSRDINAMAESLQQLEASRRRWLAELSHEMRTPLAVLRSEVEALVDGVRPCTPLAMVSLQEEVARVTCLVEDFHQLALSDLRALPCSFAPMQPATMAREAMARVQSRAQAVGLKLDCDDAGAPSLAHWDVLRIGQLLSNLFENSLRYTDAPGRIVMQVRAGDPGEAVLCIDDSAPGVPARDHSRLFEPLYRSDASRSRRSGGSGLGLAICHAIARSHGGRIEASASPLGGLRVVVTLPLQPERSA